MNTQTTNRPTAPRLWDIAKVAEHFDCSCATVRRLSKVGKLPAPIKIGGMVRWRPEDIEQFTATAA